MSYQDDCPRPEYYSESMKLANQVMGSQIDPDRIFSLKEVFEIIDSIDWHDEMRKDRLCDKYSVLQDKMDHLDPGGRVRRLGD